MDGTGSVLLADVPDGRPQAPVTSSGAHDPALLEGSSAPHPLGPGVGGLPPYSQGPPLRGGAHQPLQPHLLPPHTPMWSPKSGRRALGTLRVSSGFSLWEQHQNSRRKEKKMETQPGGGSSPGRRPALAWAGAVVALSQRPGSLGPGGTGWDPVGRERLGGAPSVSPMLAVLCWPVASAL